MRILIRCPSTQKFFNGDTFSGNRDTAYDFMNARDAIETIRAERWFSMEIVLAYAEPNDDMHISTHALGMPDEVQLGLLKSLSRPALA